MLQEWPPGFTHLPLVCLCCKPVGILYNGYLPRRNIFSNLFQELI